MVEILFTYLHIILDYSILAGNEFYENVHKV